MKRFGDKCFPGPYPAWYLGLILLCWCNVSMAASATITATINATILPSPGEVAQIGVTPSSIDLYQDGHGRLAVSNRSGQDTRVSIRVEPTDTASCQLKVTPRQASLADDQVQVFLLTYSSNDDSSCDSQFTLYIRSEQGAEHTIKVNCH